MAELAMINQLIKELKKRKNYPDPIPTENQPHPFEKFKDWFYEALLKEDQNPCVMILATVGRDNLPTTRAIAIQELQQDKLVFYSVYNGRKGEHIDHQPKIAGNFYWPVLARQVNIKAVIEKTDRIQSEKYFFQREKETQLMLHAWQQGVPIESYQALTQQLEQTAQRYPNQIPCPENWGGYFIKPYEYEFYQRRPGFKNDVIAYKLEEGQWSHQRLTP